MASKSNDLNNMGHAMKYLAQTHENLGNIKKALKCYLLSIQLYEEVNSQRGVVAGKVNLAGMYLSQGHFRLAIESYNEALSQCKVLGYKSWEQAILLNIGLVHASLQEYDVAIKHMTQLVQSDSPNEGFDLYRYYNLAHAYRDKGDTSTALHYYSKSLPIARKINDLFVKAGIHMYMGSIYSSQDENMLAQQHFDSSRMIYKKFEKSDNSGFYKILYAAFIKKKDLDSAIYFAKQAMLMSDSSSSILLAKKSSELLYELHRLHGQQPEAMKMLELSLELKDSLNAEELRRELLVKETELEYDAILKQSKLEFAKRFSAQEQAEVSVRNIFFFIFGCTLLTLVSLYILFYYRSRNVRACLLTEIQQLKEKGSMVRQALGVDQPEIILNHEMLEKAIQGKINQSDWKVLNVLFNDPYISNDDLASEVCLSLEGTSSSLRKMYQQLRINGRSNKKVMLIRECIKICSNDFDIMTNQESA